MKKKIDLDTYKRKGLFEVFKNRDVPFFATTGNVDITGLKRYIDDHGYGFFLTVSFFISKSVNLIPELRHRLIKGEPYEFDRVDPAYTILLDDETFSFCDSRHFEDFREYREYAAARIKEVRERPDLSNDEKSHMFFLTSMPWLSFTSFVHPYCEKHGSIPIITIGKSFEQGDRQMMPVGIQVHHGLVDGFHVGRFYSHLSDMCRNPAQWLG